MENIFMNSENSTLSETYRLLINLWDKTNLNMLLYQIVA